VQNFFTEETRQKAIDMIGLIKATFEERMPSRDWLSEETRAAALTKLKALSFWVGYPDPWIDYSSVSVTEDLVATIGEIAKFNTDRLRGKLGKPVEREHFTGSNGLPIVINAGYNPTLNGFEVPAGITQAPVFDASLDAAVNFCRMGAVLGHEMTHGFDRTGKSFDGEGNMRNWWTPADEKAFDERAQGLIDQANAYQVMPGVFGNGPLEVGENMADLGGITLANQALHTYLKAHPEEDVKIDGLTPDQRCFIAWTQLWAWQGLDEALRSAAANDHHPPNAYRAVAPLQHLDAFYTAFGIKEGDPMWLDPKLRVQAW
jgi:putative endopeptidase